MKLSEVFVLVAAGTLGGIFSTVVSIASLVTYPVLLALGVPPLSANMTNTVSLVLTGVGSVAGSRPELAGQRDRVLRFGAITAVGGITGAAILLVTPGSTFTAIAPVLIGAASAVLLVQPKITALAPRPYTGGAGVENRTGAACRTGMSRRTGAAHRAGVPPRADRALPADLAAHTAARALPGGLADIADLAHSACVAHPGDLVVSAGLADRADGRLRVTHGVALFAVAVYVGYFGAAAGVMLLVVLGMMISEPLVKVNAIKNAVSGAANCLAAICFAIFGSVRWLFVGPLAAGFLIGGWIGPKIARRVPGDILRVIVSLCGIGLAIRLGISAYR
jgi:uncharacterized membrane protein YfcA